VREGANLRGSIWLLSWRGLEQAFLERKVEAGRSGGGTGFPELAESRPSILADWCDAPSTTGAWAEYL